MKNFNKGFVVPVLLAIIAVLVVGGGVYVYKKEKVEIPTTVDTNTQPLDQNRQQTNTSTWKTYNFPGSPYIESGPISFKYPSDWTLETNYYTTPGGSKDITSVSITGPGGANQIAFSNGGAQAQLTCDTLLKQNESEPMGRVKCNMINGTPFSLSYINDEKALEIYNQIISTIR